MVTTEQDDASSWKFRDVESQRPPHPASFPGVHAEAYVASRWSFEALPRPDIQLPQWVRSFVSPHMSNILVSFRTLLCPESLFVALHMDAPDDQPGVEAVDAVDFVVPGMEFDHEGLPLLPEVNSSTWRSEAGDLMAAAWFAHVQYVAEVTESCLRELEAGRLTAAAVLSRVATEMAARAHRGVLRVREAETRTDQGVLLENFLGGQGGLDDLEPILRERVAGIDRIAADYLSWNADPGLYGRLCDLSHPTPKNREAYQGKSSEGYYFYPLASRLQSHRRTPRVAQDVCRGVAVATAGLLALWDDVNVLMEEFAGEGRRKRHTFRPLGVMDLAQSYPEVDMESAVCQANYQMLEHTIFTDDSPRVLAFDNVQRFAEKWLFGRTWGEGDFGDEAARAWRGLRLWISRELLQALVISLNRSCGASAAALARFVLEHLGSLERSLRASGPREVVEQLRNGASKKLDPEWLDDLLEATRLDVHASDGEATPGRVLRHASNGQVHGDFSARNLYWAQYGTGEASDLRLPGRPKYSVSSQGLPLHHPWIISLATVEIADALLLPGVRLLRGMYVPQE